MSEESEESEEESSSLESLRRVRELCEHHLSVGSEAEEHYRKVCRALVSESVELALFLEKAQKQEELHTEELVKLAQSDWVSLNRLGKKSLAPCLATQKVSVLELE